MTDTTFDIIADFAAAAENKLALMRVTDLVMVARRMEILERLKADPRLLDIETDYRAVITEHVIAVRATKQNLSIVDQNGDIGFFYMMFKDKHKKADFLKTVTDPKKLEITRSDKNDISAVVELLKKEPIIDYDVIARVVAGHFEIEPDKIKDMKLSSPVGRIAWELGMLNMWSGSSAKIDFGIDHTYRGESGSRSGPTSPGAKFRHAIIDKLNEVDRAFENKLAPPLFRGVSAVLRSYLRREDDNRRYSGYGMGFERESEPRKNLMDMTRADFEKEVDHLIRYHGPYWHTQPTNDGREQAIDVLWGACESAIKGVHKKRDEDRSWNQHRREQRMAPQ
jgi:hypothetical protein